MQEAATNLEVREQREVVPIKTYIQRNGSVDLGLIQEWVLLAVAGGLNKAISVHA